MFSYSLILKIYEKRWQSSPLHSPSRRVVAALHHPLHNARLFQRQVIIQVSVTILPGLRRLRRTKKIIQYRMPATNSVALFLVAARCRKPAGNAAVMLRCMISAN